MQIDGSKNSDLFHFTPTASELDNGKKTNLTIRRGLSKFKSNRQDIGPLGSRMKRLQRKLTHESYVSTKASKRNNPSCETECQSIKKLSLTRSSSVKKSLFSMTQLPKDCSDGSCPQENLNQTEQRKLIDKMKNLAIS